MTEEESLLTNLCAICHLQTPKYRCPRCSIRTCSLPCTRRHKLWSQCSGIRDPGAYLRRSELATESAFDRDFNFITSIERRIERAERDADDRGVDVSGKRVRNAEVVGLEHEEFEQVDKGKYGNKRKRGPESGLSRGEAGFVRRAREGCVKVIKAPAGMSRGRVNGSKWHHKQKCLLWTVEWITEEGTKRLNTVETCSVAEAYDRIFPLTKEERKNRVDGQLIEQEGEKSAEDTQKPESDAPETDPQSASEPPETQPTTQDNTTSSITEDKAIPYRNVYLYLHRPRTATKQSVLCPLSPNTTLANTLRGRTVLEFPTIYVLRKPLDEEASEEEKSKFMLEKEYLRTHPDTEHADDGGSEDTDAQPVFGAVDIPDVDESKVLEVLRNDLLGAAPIAGSG
ncbi:hypothetical protein BJY01DRAFT_214497 [Aspergillus pseudoustus]|uniref:HIT-type domain-containing protein n=1 Tax=Aspergillus pseudoustus TaxID=1810923 RepID=A0ABR4K1L4_9EURO